MSRSPILRASLAEAGRFALTAWRTAPVACGLLALGLMVPTLVGERSVGLWVALPLALGQAAAFVLGWTWLLRAAQGRPGLDGLAVDAARVLGSILLNSLFLSLVMMVLGIVLVGLAGATGLASGDDLTMVTQTVVSTGGWKTFVLLTLEIAALLLVVTLCARLMPAAPATVAERRIISLATLSWTRGTGLKPAVGLVLVLTPYILLALSVLLAPVGGAWVDGIWAVVLGLIQFPLLAGYATGLWRRVQSEGSPT